MYFSEYVLHFGEKLKSNSYKNLLVVARGHTDTGIFPLGVAEQSESLKAKETALCINHLDSSVGKFSGST